MVHAYSAHPSHPPPRRHHRQNSSAAARPAHRQQHTKAVHTHTRHTSGAAPKQDNGTQPPEEVCVAPHQHRSTGFQPLSLCLCNNQPPNQVQQWDLTQQAGLAAARVAATALLQLLLQDIPAVRTLLVGDRQTLRSSPPLYQALTAPAAPAALHRAWLGAALPSSPGDAALHPYAVCRAIHVQ